MKIASAQPQTEKPNHYTYLKEFRVNQCPLFLQHKCTQHRPFTCFNWHFANQRRRRPMRKRDGIFNYSSDVYCGQYDETTGICPNGDECPHLHRNTGDTERRYHLRYYKTGTCIHETDSRGNCVKNGPHCAFAHGARDLRPPVFDLKDTEKHDASQRMEPAGQISLAEKIITDDPKWQDGNYVLENYKTECCRRPPRLCRQGYACPQYHNPKDKRRNPKKYKYRSSPCPNVKQGDDWKDPSSCEKGDNCQFCHTRTEQQFHPEIYKSTKCHDMLQSGYCPRGPFCAFAHVHTEIRVLEDIDLSNLPAGVQVLSSNSLSPRSSVTENNPIGSVHNVSHTSSFWGERHQMTGNTVLGGGLGQDASKMSAWNTETPSANKMPSPTPMQPSERQLSGLFYSPPAENPDSSTANNTFPSCPSPIAKPNWLSSSLGRNDSYAKAPGSGRSEFQPQSVGNLGLSSSSFWGGVAAPANSHLLGRNSFSSAESSPRSVGRLRSVNLEEKLFCAPDETTSEQFYSDNSLNLDTGTTPASFTKFWPDHGGSGYGVSSSLFEMSAPVNIPQDMQMPSRYAMPTPSPPSVTSQSLFYGSLDALGGRSSYAGSLPSTGRPPSSTGCSGKEGFGSSTAELERMQTKCKQWEDSWNQAKAACEAWKKEATNANERAKVAQDASKKNFERASAFEAGLQKANQEIASLAEGIQNRTNSKPGLKCIFLHRAQKANVLKQSSVKDLRDLRDKLKIDMDAVDKVLWESYGIHCEEGWVQK